MGVSAAHMSVQHVSAFPEEARRGHQIPWDWSYRSLLLVMWVSGTDPGYSVTAVSVLKM